MGENKKVAGGVANASFKYGPKGWVMMIFSMLVYFTCCFLANDGLNIFAPTLVSDLGWDNGLIYTFNSLAGWIAIPIAFFSAWLMRKSTKICILMGLACAIIGCFWFGRMSHIVELLIVLILFQVAFNGSVFMGTSNLVANWFPTRKGTAMGWVTIGASLNTAINPTIWTILIGIFGAGFIGLGGTFNVWAVVLILLFIWCLFIKNNPEDAGAFPDNDDSVSIEEARKARDLGYLYKKSSPWTVKKLLTCKQMWIICIASGVIMMITTGIISNFVSIVMTYGYTAPQALTVMAVASIIGAVFSIAWGKVDALKGTKWACIVFYVIMCIAMVLLMLPFKPTMFIACIFVGCSLGAGNNLMASMTGTVFGRYDFDKAWGIIYPIHVAIRSAGFALVGFLSTATGTFRVPFAVMIGCSIFAIIVVMQLKDELIGRNHVTEEELRLAQEQMGK